jgi:large subunit ribosomal protein L6
MLKTEIQTPEGLDVSLGQGRLSVKGAKGEISKEFVHPLVSITNSGGKITIASEIDKKKVKAIIGTWEVLINNMFSGVSKGWKAELKLVYSHFPVKLKIDASRLVIDNFLGEKSPRKVAIPQDIKVEINQSVLTVSGPDKEKVGQLCGRIEQTTRVKGYDKRVFQDGIYITRKPYLEGEE